MNTTLASFTDVLNDEISNSQPMSFPSSVESSSAPITAKNTVIPDGRVKDRPHKGTGQRGQFRSTEEIDPKYRDIFAYPYFNLVQSRVIEDALYSDKSIVVCAPTGSGKTVVFEMAIVQLLMVLEDKQYTEDFKIIYMAPVKALCTERLTEWYSKFTKLGLLCIEVTGDTDVDFTQLKPYKIIITTPEKWDMLTRRWRDHRGLVEVIKLFLIDEVHILNDEVRGPVLEAVVSRMKTIESSAKSVHRIEQLQKELQGETVLNKSAPRIRFVAVSATVSNPEDVANWLGTSDKPAVFYKFGDECRPVKLKRVVEGYPCPEGTSIFKFDIILNYKLWPIIQKYHSGKPTLIFCNTRKSVILTAETLSRELTISFSAEQKAKLTALASTIKNKKLQGLVISGVGCHHAGLLYEERQNIEFAFRNRDLPILITTTTLAMGVNLPAHLVIVKNTQQYVNGAYQEYSISTILQMVGRAGRPQFDTEATAVIMTRLVDKPRYQALVGGCEPLQSYLHKRLAENLNSEAALGTVGDVAQCVQWLRSTFLYVRAARDPKKYLGLPQNSPQHLILKKIEELCVKAMNGLASSGLITMDEASCIESTEAGRLMSIFYLDLETMKHIMKIEGTESLDRLLALICESHELADMHLRVDERRCLNTLNRNNAAATIRFPMKGKISTRQMKLNCIIQAVLGCLPIPDPSLNQEAMRIMRIAERVCKCLVTYVTRPDMICHQPQFFTAVLNSIILAKCVSAHLWENSPFVSKQLKGIGPTFSTLLASAGKVNFMLLEESHPRDLERIMNKGAPAGNVLRKQISLLPKYQLTMIPVDEKTVTVQLVLLNQSLLSENMESLTAGDNHKSYIVVGDSNNNLLLLAAFKDKDLISVFDGIITYEVRRKHNFEHKIFAHCISSSFVGIDVQSEYLFNDLDQFLGGHGIKMTKKNEPIKKLAERQTCITDTFKERKRKNTDDIDKVQSKGKKKRDNAIIGNFKYLKESFETASKNLRKNQQNRRHDEFLNRKVTCDVPGNTIINVSCVKEANPIKEDKNILSNQNNCNEDVDSDDFADDEKIASLLNEIENEMTKRKAIPDTRKNSNNNVLCSRQQNPFSSKVTTDTLNKVSIQNFNKNLCSHRKISDIKRRNNITRKSNYSFIDLLERNLSLSDDDDKLDIGSKDNGFSEAIRSQVQKYLSKTQKNRPERDLTSEILESPKNHLPNDDMKLNNPYYDRSVIRTLHSHPRYEVKEILSRKDLIDDKLNIQRKEDTSENFICNRNESNGFYMDSINTDKIEKQHTVNEFESIISNYNANIKSNPALRPMHNINIIKYDDDDSVIHSNQYHEVKENNPSIFCINQTKCIVSNGSDKMYVNEENANRAVDKDDSSDAINKNNDISSKKDNNLNKNSNEWDEPNVNNLKLNINISDSMDVKDKYHETNNINSSVNCQSNNDNNLGKVCIVGNESDPRKIPQINDSHKINVFEQVTYSDIMPKYSNTSVENKTESHNHKQMIDNVGRNIHFNHTHSKSVCNTSESYDDSQKPENNPPENSDKQKTEYLKKYSFTSSKVDVSTKENPEYCVQIIKKVKLDLDITTIVSRKHCTFWKHKSEKEQTPKNRNQTKYINLSKPDYNDFENITPDVDESITSIYDKDDDSSVYNESQNRSKVSNGLVCLENFELLPVENIVKLPHKSVALQENNIPVIYKNDELRTCISTKNINRLSNNSYEIEKNELPNNLLKTQENFNDEDLSDGLRQTEFGNSLVNEDNKIRSILQKYGKILEKKSAPYATSNSSGINKTITCNKSPIIKSKKPFKISDIHKLHANLPKTIVDKPNAVKNKTVFSKVNDNVESGKEIEDLNSNQHCDNDEPIKEAIPLSEPISNIDLESFHLPDNVHLKPLNFFTVDQSMFDPKTLLQCVVNDVSDEIVPPPPEFCDGIISPDSENTEASMTDYSQCLEPQLNIFPENMEYNESIFDDDSDTDLTPSKEIETWNLSRQDSWHPSDLKNVSPVKSLTVMRKNTISDECSFSENSVMSRKHKLGKFKYTQKNKLKIKHKPL